MKRPAKGVLVVVALVFVVVALAAVTWNTPQGHIPWHNVLRGQATTASSSLCRSIPFLSRTFRPTWC